MKIKNAKPKGNIRESGYYQVVGNDAVAKLFQKVQSTVISNGNELERLIFNEIKHKKFDSVDKITFNKFIDLIKNATADLYFKSISINKVDFINNNIKFSGKNKMILDTAYYCFKTNTLHIGEIKNGMGLDTKKSEKEVDSLSELRTLCAIYLSISIEISIVLFICEDLSHASIKTTRTDFEKYTGKQFCEMVDISYDKIKNIRGEEGQENLEYFVTEMIKIPEVLDILKKLNIIK